MSALSAGLRVLVGMGAVLGGVALPVEVSITLTEPLSVPQPSVVLLLGSSSLLLLGSGLRLRRAEAARRQAAAHRMPD